MTDRRLVAAAAAFAVATAYSAVVTMHDPIPAQPLGIRVPGSARRHVAVGLGSALSAPWPMPALAVVAALRDRPGLAWPRRTCSTLGWSLLAGTLIEPATWGRRPRSWQAVATVPLNLLAATALAMAARRSGVSRSTLSDDVDRSVEHQ